MAGPVPMALGPFKFRAHGFGFQDVARKLSTPWAEIETVGRMNAMQWTGPGSEEISIKGVLFPHEWGGLSTLEGVRLAAKNGLPLMLVSGAGKVYGRFAVQEVSEDRSLHDRKGTPRRDAYAIRLRRHELGGVLGLIGRLL